MGKYIFILLLLMISFGCSKNEETLTRTYRMGFQNSAPRVDNINLFLQSLDIWTKRADAAIINTEVPWAKLLAGENNVQYVIDNYKVLVDFYRSKNFKLWIYIDPQNGLDRTADAVELVAAGKSIAQPEMQKIYRRFVVVMDSLFKPEHLGLALETNLIRGAATSAIYQGVKKAANDAAADVKSKNSSAKLSISIQAEVAWGKLQGAPFEGIEKDLSDFPFLQELGISSYPYLSFDKPSDIPLNFYSKLVEGKNFPVFISESGWSSQSVTTPARSFVSSVQTQVDYVTYHAQLLDRVNAIALFQLPFTDIDINGIPPTVPSNINYFLYLGLVDTQLKPKPALISWDATFARPLKTP
jgi:hypothetical protein